MYSLFIFCNEGYAHATCEMECRMSLQDKSGAQADFTLYTQSLRDSWGCSAKHSTFCIPSHVHTLQSRYLNKFIDSVLESNISLNH